MIKLYEGGAYLLKGSKLLTEEEAVKAECAKLFELPSVSRIRLKIHPKNEKSIGVATRCGFKRVGPVTDGEEPGAAKGDPDDEYILLRDEHK